MTRFYSILLGTVTCVAALPAYANHHGHTAATLTTPTLATEQVSVKLSTRGEAEARGREAEGEALRGADGTDDSPGHDAGDDHGADGAGHDAGDDHGGHDGGDDNSGSGDDSSGDDNSGNDDSGGEEDDNSGHGGGHD